MCPNVATAAVIFHFYRAIIQPATVVASEAAMVALRSCKLTKLCPDCLGRPCGALSRSFSIRFVLRAENIVCAVFVNLFVCLKHSLALTD